MKALQALFLFAETIAFTLRLWWWKRFEQHGIVRKKQKDTLFYHKGRPTRYLHTIVFKKPDYVTRKMIADTWHYYRQFKGHWVTIKSQHKLN